MGGQSNIARGITCAEPRVSSFKYILRKVRTVRNTVRGTRFLLGESLDVFRRYSDWEAFSLSDSE